MPVSRRGLILFLALGTGLGGTLFTWMTGYCIEWFGYGWIFLLMGLLHPLSFLVTAGLVRRPLVAETLD